MSDKYICSRKFDDKVTDIITSVAWHGGSEEDAMAAAKEYCEEYGHTDSYPLRIVEGDVVQAEQDEFYLSKPAKPITAERYEEMLEVLPPMRWKTGNPLIESFCLMEMQHNAITTQFARAKHNGEFYFAERYVRVTDMAGDMTREDVLRANGIDSQG